MRAKHLDFYLIPVILSTHFLYDGGQDRGDITSANETRKACFSLILGGVAGSQKTHG